jgi:RNA polymerase sigma-54 factor
MRMNLSSQMRMEQRMKLAPRMIQSMEVLQLPLLALQEKIEAELNSNPVLERVEETSEQAALPEDSASEASSEQEMVVSEDPDRLEDFQRLEELDEEFQEYIADGNFSRGGSYDPSEPDRKLEAIHNTPALSQSLQDYLKDQWRLVDASAEVRAAGEQIIENLDEKGYLTVPLEQLYQKDKSPFAPEHLRQALALVQQLDPPGVGARDVRECLLIQLRQLPEDRSFEIRLLQHFWQDLLENRLPQIAKKMNCSLEEVNKAIERLSKMDLSPGLQVGRNDNHPITADILVEPDEAGGFRAVLVETDLPNLRVNRFYQQMAKNRRVDEKTREFLQKNIRSAQWFMDAIAQRRQTLQKVAQAVVDYQRDFFEKGPLYLKPLPMSVIAEKVGVHVATVSRAVAGKYVQSPQGILPLRSFFSGGVEDENGQERSWDALKAKLQELVDNEDKSNPLSDDQLRQKLAEAGMGNIARRTVAKYRKILNIPTARFRKKY